MATTLGIPVGTRRTIACAIDRAWIQTIPASGTIAGTSDVPLATFAGP